MVSSRGVLFPTSYSTSPFLLDLKISECFNLPVILNIVFYWNTLTNQFTWMSIFHNRSFVRFRKLFNNNNFSSILLLIVNNCWVTCYFWNFLLSNVSTIEYAVLPIIFTIMVGRPKYKEIQIKLMPLLINFWDVGLTLLLCEIF